MELYKKWPLRKPVARGDAPLQVFHRTKNETGLPDPRCPEIRKERPQISPRKVAREFAREHVVGLGARKGRSASGSLGSSWTSSTTRSISGASGRLLRRHCCVRRILRSSARLFDRCRRRRRGRVSGLQVRVRHGEAQPSTDQGRHEEHKRPRDRHPPRPPPRPPQWLSMAKPSPSSRHRKVSNANRMVSEANRAMRAAAGTAKIPRMTPNTIRPLTTTASPAAANKT